MSSGISLSKEEQEFSCFSNAYRKYFNLEFNIDKINPDDFSPIRTGSHFCEVARKSKELRDECLLGIIKDQLSKHDKVLVVFGGCMC